MFIPIHAKADVQGSKKGKLTPAQASQLNAWCLAGKTGILDCLERCEAEQSMYSAVNNVATVIFKKGYLVICGRLVECEAGTEVRITTPVSGTVSGKIIARFNLANSGEEEFIVTTSTSELVQGDLNSNPITGIYEFELYSYTATPNSVTLTRRGEYVPDIGEKLKQFEESLMAEGKPLSGYDTAKGTIEQRLTNLGFRSGSVTVSGGTATTNIITRQGNYIIGKIVIEGASQRIDTAYTMTLPSEFRPKEQVSFLGGAEVRWVSTGGASLNYEAMNVTISPNGTISLVIASSPYQSTSGFFIKTNLNFGFEANPIT